MILKLAKRKGCNRKITLDNMYKICHIMEKMKEIINKKIEHSNLMTLKIYNFRNPKALWYQNIRAIEF